MQNLTEEQLRKLTELERRQWHKLYNSKWYIELPPHIQAVVKDNPPYLMYILKDNEQLVYIAEYNDKIGDAACPVMLSVKAHPDYNEGLVAIHDYFGVPPEALEKYMLRSIIDQERIVFAQKAASSFMPLANRAQAMRRARRVEGERNKEKIDHVLNKAKNPSVSLYHPTGGIIVPRKDQ